MGYIIKLSRKIPELKGINTFYIIRLKANGGFQGGTLPKMATVYRRKSVINKIVTLAENMGIYNVEVISVNNIDNDIIKPKVLTNEQLEK